MPAWSLASLPIQPHRLDLRLQDVSDLQLAALQLHLTHGQVNLVVVTEQNRWAVAEQLVDLGRFDSGTLLESVVLVMPLPIAFPQVI